MSQTTLDFRLLADHPELTATLAGWFAAEWSRPGFELNPQEIETNLKERLNRDRIPLVVLAFQQRQLVATAALKIQEMETHPQYQYWLGGVYTIATARGQGHGTAVVQHSARRAAELGVADLYLYTNSHAGFYNRLGWQVIERPLYHGLTVTIMHKGLT